MKKTLQELPKLPQKIKFESFYLIYIIWLSALTCSGGFLNTLGIIIFGDSISHFSGNISRIAIEYQNLNYTHMNVILNLILFYFLGSIFSGILIKSHEFSFKNRYGVVLISIGFTILLLYLSFYGTVLFKYSLPFLLGIQNGLFISYKGVVVRTTHITGSLTDAGVYFGQAIRGERQYSWKILFYSLNIFMFFLGSFLGMKIFNKINSSAFIIIAFVYIGIGSIYFFMKIFYFDKKIDIKILKY